MLIVCLHSKCSNVHKCCSLENEMFEKQFIAECLINFVELVELFSDIEYPKLI